MPTKPIETRVDVAIVKELDRQAAARSLTRAQYLRTIVMDAVSDHGTDAILAKLEELERLTVSLHHNLRVATSAVLGDLQNVPGKIAPRDVDHVKDWVAKNLK